MGLLVMTQNASHNGGLHSQHNSVFGLQIKRQNSRAKLKALARSCVMVSPFQLL
jgi:hypothetical protein